MKSVKAAHYLEDLKKLHPNMKEADIKKIISFGCWMIMNNLKVNKDVMIESSRKKIKFVIYKYVRYSDQVAKNEKIIKKRI